MEQAAWLKGRMDRPVLLSARVAVRVARSTLRPAEPESFTKPPAGQSQEARHGDRGWPHTVLRRFAKPVTQRLVLRVAEPALALPIRRAHHSANRIVGSNATTHRITEDALQ